MTGIKKYLTSIFSLSYKNTLIALFVLFLLTRLINITTLPMFNDEATYIDWSWRMVNLEGEFFHSVKHAKPPLFMWIVGLVRNVITNPLLAGRIVSVMFGGIGTLGLYKLSKLLFNRKTATLASLFYITIPIFVFFDRQALMETSIAACGIWSFYFFIKTLNSKMHEFAIYLGITLGVGYLIKTSAVVFALPIFFFFVFEYVKHKDNFIKSNFFIVIFTFLTTTSPLLFSKTFWSTLSDNSRYIFTLSELFKFPIQEWVRNIGIFLSITFVYLNPLTMILSIIAIYSLLRSKEKIYYYLIAFIFAGLFFNIFIDRVTIVRHIMPFLPLVLLLAAHQLNQVSKKNKILALPLTIGLLSISLTTTFLLISKPLTYFYTLNKLTKQSQKNDYVSNWSSGYGFSEVKKFIDSESRLSPIVVGVRLDAGTPENTVFAYYAGSKKVAPVYLDSRLIANFSEYDCIKSKYPIYFISRDNQLAGLNKHLIEIQRVYKPENKNYIGIHKINENCDGNVLQLF